LENGGFSLNCGLRSWKFSSTCIFQGFSIYLTLARFSIVALSIRTWKETSLFFSTSLIL
jgi:hypothetical protein